jgi:hypothetical protein
MISNCGTTNGIQPHVRVKYRPDYLVVSKKHPVTELCVRFVA